MKRSDGLSGSRVISSVSYTYIDRDERRIRVAEPQAGRSRSHLFREQGARFPTAADAASHRHPASIVFARKTPVSSPHRRKREKRQDRDGRRGNRAARARARSCRCRRRQIASLSSLFFRGACTAGFTSILAHARVYYGWMMRFFRDIYGTYINDAPRHCHGCIRERFSADQGGRPLCWNFSVSGPRFCASRYYVKIAAVFIRIIEISFRMFYTAVSCEMTLLVIKCITIDYRLFELNQLLFSYTARLHFSYSTQNSIYYILVESMTELLENLSVMRLVHRPFGKSDFCHSCSTSGRRSFTRTLSRDGYYSSWTLPSCLSFSGACPTGFPLLSLGSRELTKFIAFSTIF